MVSFVATTCCGQATASQITIGPRANDAQVGSAWHGDVVVSLLQVCYPMGPEM